MKAFLRMARSAMIALALAGCVTATGSLTGVDGPGRMAFLQFAGANGPVYLVAVNPPVGTARSMAEAVVVPASDRLAADGIRFTTDRGAAPRRDYRLIALFDPVPGITPDQACSADRRPPVAARYADRTNLMLAFCAEDVAVGAAKVRGPRIESLSDPAIDRMTTGGLAEVFPPQSLGPGNDTATFGSLELSPRPRFRLNPLDGIVGN